MFFGLEVESLSPAVKNAMSFKVMATGKTFEGHTVEPNRRPNPSYTKVRDDLLTLVPSSYSRVLDLGCSEGANGRVLKDRNPNAWVTGVELDPVTAATAEGILDTVIVGDAQECLENLVLKGEEFDLVLAGDILEHLVDPWQALGSLQKLCPKGFILVSLPNVGHWSTLFSLFFLNLWPYRNRGIHDRTHLRFFARRNLKPFFASGGFRIEKIITHHRIREKHRTFHWLEWILAKTPCLRNWTTFQFICRLRPHN